MLNPLFVLGRATAIGTMQAMRVPLAPWAPSHLQAPKIAPLAQMPTLTALCSDLRGKSQGLGTHPAEPEQDEIGRAHV